MKRVADEATAELLARAILDPRRGRPVVAVSVGAGRTTPSIDVEELERTLGDSADVYLVETGPATWELAERLPERMEVYGEAVRLWWPGAGLHSDPFDHPLFLIFGSADAERKRSELLAELAAAPATAARADERPRAGEIVHGTVTQVVPYGVFLDVRGYRGLVHVSQLSDDWVEEPGDVVGVGDEVRARVLETEDGRLAFSFREERRDDEADLDELRGELERAKGEIRELAAERRELLAERTRLKERLRQLESARREERSRERVVVENEDDFRRLVELEYETRYVGDDRIRWPLREYRLNRSFLETVKTIEGLSVEKIAEVSAHVVTGRAHELPGLDVHQLHDGKGGAPQRERARDGAKAWRCALQREAAGARRLHWWALRGSEVELASVGHHDDYGIPE